jgi:hypothetical protein
LSVRHWAICVCVAEPDPGQFVTRRRPGVSVAAAFVRPPDVLTMVSPAADSASAAGGRRVGPPSSRQCRETPEPFVPTDRGTALPSVRSPACPASSRPTERRAADSPLICRICIRGLRSLHPDDTGRAAARQQPSALDRQESSRTRPSPLGHRHMTNIATAWSIPSHAARSQKR